MTFTLVSTDGSITRVPVENGIAFAKPTAPLTSRVGYAAVHIVPRVVGDNVPGAPADIDWDATLALRHHVWSWGLGVADAMDTAQRNMGLDWAACAELIRRSAAEARQVGGAIAVGVNTDHIEDAVISIDAVVSAYRLQLEVAEESGATPVVMASRHLARAAHGAGDFERVYERVLSASNGPVILHWLGAAFDESLAGYFGSADTGIAADTVIRIIEKYVAKVRGIKISLLDADSEIALRRRLPAGVRMFTGDDFNYVDLIEGDEVGHSDALLGAFAAIAPTASAAIRALDVGDGARYRELLDPTTALSRQVFAAPTQYYKTGVAFLSWLNGHQEAFRMVGGLHAGRNLVHLSEIVRLANEAHVLEAPELAAARWNGLLALDGVR